MRTACRTLAHCIVLAATSTLQAQPYYTHALRDDIHSLRVVAGNDFERLRVMDMAGNIPIEISFDVLGDEQTYMAYDVVHCTRDWEPSDLSTMDYMEGFLPVRVGHVRPSFNTFVDYWHYSITFPNDDIRLTASGNYAVIIHPEGQPDEPVAVATFSVSEQMAFVDGAVSANTDLDYRNAHQQLTLGLGWSASRLPHLDAASDVTLVVRQNQRDDTRRVVEHPTRIAAAHAYYEHLPALIYTAGNNFHRFEFVDEHYTTIGVDRVRFHEPYFYVSLVEDRPRATLPYYYDKDQHGRYLVKAARVDDSDTESDYFWAQFRLVSPPKGTVTLVGDFASAAAVSPTMVYDMESGTYTAEVLLKQGAYNYAYATDGQTTIDGDHYETPNQYDIWVYYHPVGARYDRLLGTATMQFEP